MITGHAARYMALAAAMSSAGCRHVPPQEALSHRSPWCRVEPELKSVFVGSINVSGNPDVHGINNIINGTLRLGTFAPEGTVMVHVQGYYPTSVSWTTAENGQFVCDPDPLVLIPH